MDNKVLDEAVEVALGFMPASLTHSQAWPTGYVDGHNDAMQTVEDHMRAALLAGVKVLLGEVAEVVGEMTDYIDQEVDPEMDVVERWRDQMRSYLNAPSLGEGDGR